MSFEKLRAHYRRIGHLTHVSRIVGWDEAVMMPKGGGAARADAMATLEGLIHELGSAPYVRDWLENAKHDDLSVTQRAALREIERVYVRATILPQELVEAQSRAQIRCEQAWRVQRKENDWAGHKPLLEEVFRLKREEASIVAAQLSVSPYEALMDAYEPGMRKARLDAIFDVLEPYLAKRLPEVIERQKSEKVIVPRGPFAIEAQRELGLAMMRVIGFDFEHGRLDTSHHPFCGGVPEDVRMTTRYNEHDFTQSLMGVLHETGHAKYEQHLPRELCNEPVGQARSMGLHESQSLFQEMQICRGRPFLELATPLIRKAFPEQAKAQPDAFTPENLTRLYTRVSCGKIRVDADEVSYPLHVILRYRIERDLVEGKMDVRHLPDAWDQAMTKSLGLSTAGDFRDGCMQDVHWPSGAIGYFPSYTLGALIAAQLHEALAKELPNVGHLIATGDLAPIDAFLNARVWSRGSELESDALIEQATSLPLGPDAFMRHVERRYLS